MATQGDCFPLFLSVILAFSEFKALQEAAVIGNNGWKEKGYVMSEN